MLLDTREYVKGGIERRGTMNYETENQKEGYQINSLANTDIILYHR